MVLAKASLGILSGMSPLGNPFSTEYTQVNVRDAENDLIQLETTMQTVLGLQNDILGEIQTISLQNLGLRLLTAGYRLGEGPQREVDAQLHPDSDC